MGFLGYSKKIMKKILCTIHDGDEVETNPSEVSERNAITPTILDVYVKEPPSPEAAFRIFEGKWSSDVPGYGLGSARLFDDDRIKWFEQQCGGLKGKRILELGPLEGGHTYMLSKAGAERITSIEANTTAFLKCLIVQNTLKFNADFMLGDCCEYLESCNEKFDFLLASGVLYHMADPAKLIQDMTKVSKSIGIWTHYFDADIIFGREDLKRKFESEPKKQQIGNREVVLYKQSYLEALDWAGFCGGSAPTSYWLTRDSLIGLFEDLGFKVTVGSETKDTPHGPAILLFASR